MLSDYVSKLYEVTGRAAYMSQNPLDSLSQQHCPYDNNTYTFGRVDLHNVVIACLQKGKYDFMSTASVAKDMRCSFLSIRFGLMVGIASGAPSLKHDIRLVTWWSVPVSRTGGVIHYKVWQNGIKPKLRAHGGRLMPYP